MRLLNLPGAPALLDRVGGRSDPAGTLRTICHRAVQEMLTDDVRRVIIVAPGPRTGSWPATGDYPIERLVGGRSTAPDPLPLPLAVGRGLIGDRLDGRQLLLRTIGTGEHGRTRADRAGDDARSDQDVVDGPDDLLVVAIADGSALGRPGGPDTVHPRAADFDRSVVEAWRSGDPAALAALDSQLGAAVMATGAVVWSRLSRLAGGRRFDSTISYADAPFGTFYLVAGWR